MRVAYFSPINPNPSGISDYSEALLPHLAERVDSIDLFLDQAGQENRQSPAPANANLRVRPWTEFEADHRAGRYDAVLYHIGNNPFHVYIYDLALRIPGILVLHEFNLHYLVAHATVALGNWERYLKELEHDAGPGALARARRAQTGAEQLDYDNIPLNRSLLERSQAVIVHSEYMVNLLRGAGFRLPVRRIPHGVDILDADRQAARSFLAEKTAWSLDQATPVFGAFGFLKPYKRIHESLRALARLREEYPAVKMVLVGEEHPHYPLRPLIAELELQDCVKIMGYVPLEEFTQYMAAVDYCINLRRPTAGETSGSFLRALGMGKPTLVSEIGSFLELPDDVAIKIPLDDKEERWLYEYMKLLLEQPELARAVGEKGREYVEQGSQWPQVADQYVQSLRECVQGNISKSDPMVATAEPSNGKQSRALPAEDELAEYIVGFSHSSQLMEDYVLTHLTRLVRTVEMTPPGHDGEQLLELGCYMQITPALSKFLGYAEVRGAYYGKVGEQATHTVTSASGERFSCMVDHFNAESDRFPYGDSAFHTVLCCELIEHLSTDPMHMMAEINRILERGGHLLLTTPNITSFRSVYAVLHGHHPSLFPPYIKPSLDGEENPRHNREYTPHEITRLAEAAGFEVVRLETGGFGRLDPDPSWARNFLESNRLSTDLRGEGIFCLARKAGPVRDRWPKSLYYS